MATGHLVTLGNDTIDPGDEVSNSEATTYTSSAFLGRGSVRWTNGGSSAQTSGSFYQDEDGNVYFEPDRAPDPRVLGGTAEVVSFSGTQPSTMLCFLSGTRIATPDGCRRVEDLAVNDWVYTQSGDAAPILWTGSRPVPTSSIRGLPDGRPIDMRSGAGLGRLRLSPQHGVKVETATGPILVRAKHLAQFGLFGARRLNGNPRHVRFHHFMLPRHALVRADDVWCESFWPGPLALASLPRSEASRILDLIAHGYGPPILNYATCADLRRLVRPDGSGRSTLTMHRSMSVID